MSLNKRREVRPSEIEIANDRGDGAGPTAVAIRQLRNRCSAGTWLAMKELTT